MNFSQKTVDIVNKAQEKLAKQFAETEEISTFNQLKVLNAFQQNSVGLRHLSQTNG